jgi:hypothetical protein
MLLLLSVYMYFRFRVWPGHYGKMGEFFMSALFLGAVMGGSLYLGENGLSCYARRGGKDAL